MNLKKLNNKFLCLEPFQSLYFCSDWSIKFCCNFSWKIWNIKKQNIEEILNSNIATKVRKSILNWNLPNECNYCKNEININIKNSYSKKKNIYNFFNINNNIDINPIINLNKIIFININFSNLCNFSCIMCNSKRSISRNLIDTKIWDKSYSKLNIFNNFKKNFFDKLNNDSKLNTIMIKWWEPFIEKDQYNFLNEIIKKWISKNISLVYSTNLSILPWINWYEKLLPKWYKTIFELWKNFKNIIISASCEWTWKTYEYIRRWWNRDTYSQNLKHLKNNSIYFYIFCTIQIDNIENFLELIDFSIENNYVIKYWYVVDPNYLSITILPKSLKDIIKKKYENFIKSRKLSKNIIQMLNDIIKLMYSKNYNKKLYEKYLQFSDSIKSIWK